MAFTQIVLILCPPIDAPSIEATVTRALAACAHPPELRFALPDRWQLVLPDVPVLRYHGDDGWREIASRFSRETHFLLLSGAHAFAPKWDAALMRLARSLPPQVLLTALVSPAPVTSGSEPFTEDTPTRRVPAPNAEGTLPQAYLPALKKSLSDTEVVLGRGLPLVCTPQPVRTMLVNPDCLFGPVCFLRDCDLHPETLSLSAYAGGYGVYALHQPLFWPVIAPKQRVLVRPTAEALPGTTLSRFEQLLGFSYGQPYAEGKAAMGLFGPGDSYPQRIPPMLQIQQKSRTLSLRMREQPLPLLVSAITDLPSAQRSPIATRLRFGFLRQISCLPLLLYTGGRQERSLRLAFPNTQNYPENGLLPRSLLANGMRPQEHFDRSKPLLLLHTIRRRTEFTHAAWIDSGAVPHPICSEAVPAFRSLMDDRIHMATVDGVPDGGFIMIPAKLLPAVARLALSVTQLDAELKRGFDEALLWERLFVKKPEWFAFHPMPRRGLLFLSLLDASLLSHPLQQLLAKREPVYYASQADVPARPAKEKKP